VTIRGLLAALIIGVITISNDGCSREKFGTFLPEEALSYILSPSSSMVFPLRVLQADGKIDHPEAILARDGIAAHLERQAIGPPARLIVDFGREVGGFLTIKSLKSNSPALSIAFSESIDFLEPAGDLAAAAFTGTSERHFHVPQAAPELWKDPLIRGGFRYLIISLDGVGWVDIDAVWCEFTSFLGTPETFRGYFLSDDDLLNRAWYAGVYTVDMCTIKARTGTPLGEAVLGPGPFVIVDGPKRDRVVWSGDMIVSAPVLLLSHGRSDIVRDSLASLSDNQWDNGYIPAASRAGAGLLGTGFGEYTAWWVILARLYDLYTGDTGFLNKYWPVIKKAMSYLQDQEGPKGLFLKTPENVNEWCYSIRREGEPSYVNAVYYKALKDASALANVMGEPQLSSAYAQRAEKVKAALHQYLWNAVAGAFSDSTVDFVHIPEDGNSLALLYDLVDDPAEKASILTYLKNAMWTPWGSTNVDVPYTETLFDVPFHNKRVVPFVNYFEVMARFHVGDEAGAFDLMKRCWGNMLGSDDPQTFWEFVGPDGRPERPYVSLSHGWSAGITAILTTQVLGVEPLDRGFSKYRISPHLGPLSWAEGRVPTPHGDIFVRVENINGRIKVAVQAPEAAEGTLVK